MKKLVVIAVGLALPRSAGAQPSAAELFESGLEAMKRGDYAAACPAIAESHRLEPLPGALFTLAECEARAGLVASSWKHFGEFLELASSFDEQERARQGERLSAAEERRRELEPDLSRLALVMIDPIDARAALELDGTPLPRERWGEPLIVDPGLHRLVLHLPGGEVTRIVQVERGKSYRVRFSPPKPKSAARAPAPPAPRRAAPAPDTGVRATWITGWIALGVGAAGLATAGGVGIALLQKKEAIAGDCVENRCNARGLAEIDDVGTLDAVGTAAFVVGTIGVVGGVSLLVIDSTVRVTSDGRSAMIVYDGRW